MYTNFYKLTEGPFKLTPSTRFLYMSETHKKALVLLKYVVVKRKGPILLTGDVGTGKTTMIRALLDSLDRAIPYVHMSNPLLSPQEFIDYVAYSTIRIKKYPNDREKGRFACQQYLKRCVRENKNLNLIIDEAHKLSFELFELIRLLSKMETDGINLMNILLVGQPELNDKLSEMRGRSLLQRISIRHHILPLNLDETREYMGTRLKVAGAHNMDQIFSKNAVQAIYNYTKGCPREINNLADNALVLGYSRGIRTITPPIIHECFEDIKLDRLRSIIQRKQTESRPPKITKFFFRPLIHWKAACGFLLLAFIFVLVARGNGKDTLLKLKALVPNYHQAKYSLLSREPLISKQIIHKRVEVVPHTKTHEADISYTSRDAEKRSQEMIKIFPEAPILVEKTKSEILNNRSLEVDIPNLEEIETNVKNLKRETSTILQKGIDDILKIENDKQAWKTLIVKEGDSLIKLVAEAYGRAHIDYLKFVQKFNPEIEDINKIKIGQEILFPPIVIEGNRTEDTSKIDLGNERM